MADYKKILRLIDTSDGTDITGATSVKLRGIHEGSSANDIDCEEVGTSTGLYQPKNGTYGSITVSDNKIPEGSYIVRYNGASTDFTVKVGKIVNDDLADDSVDGDKIADDSIDSPHYVDGSVDDDHLATGIDFAKLDIPNYTEADSSNYSGGALAASHLQTTHSGILSGISNPRPLVIPTSPHNLKVEIDSNDVIVYWDAGEANVTYFLLVLNQ